MSETEGTDLNAMEREPPIWTPPISQISSGRQQAASLILCAALIVAGLYILSNYLRALVWALVLAVALWPAYDRLRRKTRRSFAKKLLPILVTALVGSTVFLPLTVLAIEVVREVHEIVDYGRSVETQAFRCLSLSLDCHTADRGLPTGGTGTWRMLAGQKTSYNRSTHLQLANSDAALGLTRSIAPYCLAYVS